MLKYNKNWTKEVNKDFTALDKTILETRKKTFYERLKEYYANCRRWTKR